MSGNDKSFGGWLQLRRQKLGLSRAEAARRVGVTRQSWHAWETDVSVPQDHNYAGIERVLEWEFGSVCTVLSGGEPTPMPEAEPPDPAHDALLDAVSMYIDRYGEEEGLRRVRADLGVVVTPPHRRPRRDAT